MTTVNGFIMAESPVVGVRFPSELLSTIDALVGKEGKTRSEVVLTLVRRALNIDPNPDTQAILSRLDELEKKLLTCRTSTSV